MNVLVLFAHPLSDSYGRAIYDEAVRSLNVEGHDLRIHDLWQEGFDPMLSAAEKHAHFAGVMQSCLCIQVGGQHHQRS